MDCMDLKSNHTAPVLTDSSPKSKSRLGIHSTSLSYLSPVNLSPSLYMTIQRKMSGKFDDVCCHSWLDAMKSSSPTHMKIAKDPSADLAQSDPDSAYHSWMLKYPSVLASFNQITDYAKGKRIVLFLDYDGTLSPIVHNPDSAFMSSSMRAAVKNVAKYFPTAIISGRSRNKVYEFVGLTELYYAGSHGMDIMGPVNHPNYRYTNNQDKKLNAFQPASEFLPMIDEVFNSLVEVVKDIEGANVENNQFCVSVHYRNVDEHSWSTIGQYVQDILKDYPRLRLTHGRKVLEVRPEIDWDKGKAVEFLLESIGLDKCDDVLPIYVGDDRTDEDAFKVLKDRNQGYGILVSSVPKESYAAYSLRNPSEVMEFLKFLVILKKN